MRDKVKRWRMRAINMAKTIEKDRTIIVSTMIRRRKVTETKISVRDKNIKTTKKVMKGNKGVNTNPKKVMKKERTQSIKGTTKKIPKSNQMMTQENQLNRLKIALSMLLKTQIINLLMLIKATKKFNKKSKIPQRN